MEKQQNIEKKIRDVKDVVPVVFRWKGWNVDIYGNIFDVIEEMWSKDSLSDEQMEILTDEENLIFKIEKLEEWGFELISGIFVNLIENKNLLYKSHPHFQYVFVCENLRKEIYEKCDVWINEEGLIEED